MNNWMENNFNTLYIDIFHITSFTALCPAKLVILGLVMVSSKCLHEVKSIFVSHVHFYCSF